MKIKLLIFSYLLIFNSLNGQVNVSGTIFNSETNQPISFVNVGVMGSPRGTVSDEAGKFSLNQLSKSDTIVISSIGYRAQKLPIEKVISNKEIFLIPIQYQLNEIKVSASNFNDEVLLGEKNEKESGHSFGFGSAQLGTELATLVEIKKETLIKSVHFVLNHAKGDSLLLRINIYDYSDGEIGQNLLTENIIIREKQRKGEYHIDITNQELVLNNNVLLSVEWLKDFNGKGNELITFDTKKSKTPPGTFIRYASNSPFIQLSHKKKYKPCLYFMGKQSAD